MSQMYFITAAFSAFVLAISYLGMFTLIEYLNLRFPILLKVALSLPQRTSYGRISSALISGGSFSSIVGFIDLSSFSSLDVPIGSCAFFREYSLSCLFTDIFGKVDELLSIFFPIRRLEDIEIFEGKFMHNIADDPSGLFGLFLFQFRLYELGLGDRSIDLLIVSFRASLFPNVKVWRDRFIRSIMVGEMPIGIW